MSSRARILVLFDVDGTLTPARRDIEAPMIAALAKLRSKVFVGVVGGSDFPKQQEQLGEKCLDHFDYNFAENGLVAFKAGQPLPSQSLVKHLGEDKLQDFINFTLGELAQIRLPFKRGNFIEFRTGMINVSPVGRSVTQAERQAFYEYDMVHNVRAKLVDTLRAKFGDALGLTFSIGGQISFDVFPKGWDKTFCLNHLMHENFDEIHFFGDKTDKGGNDHEIYTDPRVKGHTVTSPEDTISQLQKLFGI